MIEWNDDNLERYSRHIILEEVGIEGQEKLASSSVLIIGAGGLGSPIALYLAAAGVGKIGIVDFDAVDLGNLQRQVAHTTADIGKPKVISAKESMLAINPDIEVIAIEAAVDENNILSLIEPYDFVIDGTDNFAAKFLINDACVLANKPYSHGGILRFSGQTMTVKPHESACYACAFDAPPPANSVPTCSTAGILGAVAGMLGTIQAAETLKHLLNIGTPASNKIVTFDVKNMRFQELKIAKNPKCRVCSDSATIKLGGYEQAVCDVKKD